MTIKIPMTQKGYDKLTEELIFLRNTERPNVIKAIQEARSHGDLSENAEYHAAKDRQGIIEARISDIENKLLSSEIIDISKLSGDKVTFGATVTLVDEDTEKTKKYQIVGSDEADLSKGQLSITSPLAQMLIGKAKGDSIEVNAPNGILSYHIENVEFFA